MIGPMTPHRPGAAGLAALLAFVLVAGCGSPGPTGAPAASPAASTAPSSTEGAGPTAASTAGPTGANAASPAASTAPSAATNCSDASAAASFSPQPIGPDDPNAALLSKIESEVQTIRGITADHQVARYTLDQAGLCAFLRESLNRDNPPALVAATDKLYKQLGMLPAGASLESLYLNLLTSQVVGFYDQHTKSMYVISSSGAIGPVEEITYAHEFDHALQDQKYGLQTILGDAKDQSDRTLARTALIEGDATLVMSLWAQQNLTPAQLVQVAGSTDPASQAALDAAPPILRQTLLWPYTQGLMLVLGAYQTSASFAGVDALWQNPPNTTEQLLHPDKLATREPAVPVVLPADLASRLGTGWTVAMQDTLGELELNILMQTGNPQAGTDPAAGWGGDRVALVEGPGGAAAAVLDTAWDTTAAASSAVGQLHDVVTVLQGEGKRAAVLQPSGQRVELVSADSDATLSAVANVLGLAG
jgi:hypothetical protein